jgi:hypothetical protein
MLRQINKTVAFLAGIFFAGTVALSAQNIGTVKLTFKYSVTHIEKGYDHPSRMKIYVNGQFLAVSSERMESRPNRVTVNLAPGGYLVRAVLESLHEGRWEEHTRANGYNIDCFFSGSVKIEKDMTIPLVFDLNKGLGIKSNSQ